MSSLWTPGGEHEIPRSHPEAGPADGPPSQPELDPEMEAALAAMSPEERAQAEQMITEMARAREELAQTPAATIVANHAMGLYELGAIHLSQQPPHLEEAALAVDGLTALLAALEGRLGEHEATLRQAVTQLQMAFVELTRRASGPDEGESQPAAGG